MTAKKSGIQHLCQSEEQTTLVMSAFGKEQLFGA
jgi:hypothetical protein